MKVLIIFACLSLESIFAINIIKKNVTEESNTTEGSPAPVTDSQPSTPTSEVPQVPCPPDKSLNTKEDIKIMIDYRIKTQLVYKSINNSYYSQAVAVRDKHMNDFNQFRGWYLNRPEHLKHVIEDIALLRSHVEPYVQHIALATEQYPQLKEKYDEKLIKTNTLIKTLTRYNNICENNCESKNLIRISRRSDFNGYYCSSLEDLDRKIKSKLTELTQSVTSAMLDRVSNDDKMYRKKIDALKNILKDAALKEFGRTMYDILNLQDEYHHFFEDLMEVDANSEVYKIKECYLHIDTKLLDLEQRIQNYGTNCRTCNKISLRSISKKSYRQDTFKSNEAKPKDLVDHLLELEYREIQNSTDNEYSNMFIELNTLLNNTDSEDIYLTDLKPIQDEIIDMLNKQKTNFEELKTIASPSAVTKLIKLSSESKQLLSYINKNIEFLDKIIPK